MTSRVRDQAEDLDDLIVEITVDCYDDDEALMGFEAAFDEQVRFPVAAHVLGEEIEVVAVGRRDGRRELAASCDRSGCRYDIALLDVDLQDAGARRLAAAYRRWLGP